MKIQLPKLSSERLTVTVRLFLINGLLVLALAVLSTICWRANDAQRRAMSDLTLISRAARFHQDADTQNANLRADVSAALGSSSHRGLSREAVMSSLAEDSEALRHDIRDLDRFQLPGELAESLSRVRDLEESYWTRASETVKTVLNSPDPDIDQLKDFYASYESLQQAMLLQTAALGRRIVAANDAAETALLNAKRLLLVTAGLTILVVCSLVAMLSASIRNSLRRVRDVAQAIAAGDLSARAAVHTKDEFGSLSDAMNQLAANLGGVMDKLRIDSEKESFRRNLGEALDMVDTEADAYGVVARVMEKVAPRMPMELLVSDSSRAHLERATQHPQAGSPGCSVESPFSCVAVRRGTVATFADSDSVNACPRLRDRPGGAVSAVCVPLSFMGRSIGVLHAAAPLADPVPEQDRVVAQLGALAQQAASRVGTLRAFRRTQIQATTDSLTGLVNRRTLEEHVRKLHEKEQSYALVLCDLDHFKKLNDSHGHQAGDMALRLFSDVLRGCMRGGDLPARWGGEEFVMVLGNCDAAQALEAVNRLQAALAHALLGGSVPAFSVSYGIADTTMGAQLDELTRLADHALYQAKEQGRDRAVIAGNRNAAHGVPRRDAEHLAVVDMRLVSQEA